MFEVITQTGRYILLQGHRINLNTIIGYEASESDLERGTTGYLIRIRCSDHSFWICFNTHKERNNALAQMDYISGAKEIT